MSSNEFHTFNSDMHSSVTATMEDYIEMIYRISLENGYVRIYELSKMLNVKPSSVTKMVQKLSELGYVKYQKYEVIILEDKGLKLGEKLLNRHNTVESLLRILKISEENILSETEKIEHTISEETLQCIDKFVSSINDNIVIINETENK